MVNIDSIMNLPDPNEKANKDGKDKEKKSEGLSFEQNYFEDREKKVSNYVAYSDRNYDGLCNAIIETCRIQKDDFVVDYGCATGVLVLAFRKRGYNNVIGNNIFLIGQLNMEKLY